MIINHRISISLLEFLRTGRFDFIKIGMSRVHVLQVFPEPEEWGLGNTWQHAGIWRYGNFELHFQDDTLIRIFNDYFPNIDGGQYLDIDAWILNKKLSLLTLQAALNQSKISYQTYPNQSDQIIVKILPSHVELLFCPEREESSLSTDPNQYVLAALSKNQ
jgi:hypothetical protein